MERTYECSQFVIFDDVLPTSEFEAVWRYLQLSRVVNGDMAYLGGPWQITEALPLFGATISALSESTSSPARPSPATGGSPVYPTGTAVDFVVEKLFQLAPQIEPWVGKVDEEWVLVTAAPWIFPPGTGISWHTDSGAHTGAYILYVHPEWEAQWGGELLVAEKACRLFPSGLSTPAPYSLEERLRYRFDKRPMSDYLRRVGTGQFISPAPNRLVVLEVGHPHKTSRVDAAAGDHVRASISGLFVRPEVVERSEER
jgi:hypothetical protein